MKRWATLIILLLGYVAAYAQDESATDVVAHILEEMSENGTLTEDFESEAAELVAFASDKLDVNTVTTEQINKLFFLSEKQKEIIVQRREQYGPYRSESELVTLPYFSYADVERLLYFVSVGKSNAEPIRAYTAHLNIVLRGERTFPDMRGLQSKNDTIPAAFLGDRYKKLLRINAAVGEKLVGGLVAESDVGEPMFSHGVSTTDFLSGFLSYIPNKKFVRKVIIGHYSARFGQGLGMWTGFSPDMSAFQTSLMRSGTGLSGNMSASESGYLRGVAVAMGNSHISIDAFFSHTDGDASIIEMNDTLSSEYYASTIQTSGYHRTMSELSKRNNFQQMVGGAYLRYTNMNLSVSGGFNIWHGSMPIGNKGELYKLFYPTSQNICIGHIDYRYVFRKLTLYGEVAYQSTKAFAAMQGLDVDLGSGNSLTLAYRSFAKSYYALYQNPYSVSNQPGGESGVYMGVYLLPFVHTSVSANVNVFYNSWLRYQKMSPTNGYKGRITIAHNFSRNNTLSVRFRIDNRDDASSTNNKQIERVQRTSVKLSYNHRTNYRISFRTVAEKVKYKQDSERANGFWLSEDVAAKLFDNKLSVDLQLAHFDAQSYDSRIFATQPDVLYSMSMPTYIGRGALGIASVCWSPLPLIDVWLWGRYVKYYDRDIIGSGNNQIDASHKIDVKLQTRIKFRYWKKRIVKNN